MSTPALAAGSGTLMARGAVIATVMVFGLTYSLTAPLIAFDLAARGHSAGIIGANAAMHAVGALMTALLLPSLVALLGTRILVLASIALSALVFLAFPHMPSLGAWFVLRFLLGIATETLFVTSETWINALAPEQSRARTMAAYTAALSLGLALGPLILSLVGVGGALPYLVGAGLALVAGLFVASPKVRVPHLGEPSIRNPVRYLRIAPFALSAVLLTAGLETSALSFLPLYAMGHGWSADGGTRLVTVMMLGAIALQMPIGWLGDMVDRRRLVASLATLCGLGAAAWPLALGSAAATHALFFLWGGAFMGVYTIVITLVGSRFKGGDLVGIFAVAGLFWGVGSLVGPLSVGLALQANPHGFAVLAALACGAFALAAWRAGRANNGA